MGQQTDLEKSIILNTDSYKLSHWLQYPPAIRYMNAYLESRGGRWHRTVFYGLQAFLRQYLVNPVTRHEIDLAEEFVSDHGLPFNRAGWMHILEKHNGFLPLRIEAVREGTVLPTSLVLVQVRNTDPAVPWLPTYIETALLRSIWYPVAVATSSYMCKQIIRQYLETTGTPEEIDFKLHDFGARGVSSLESAGIGGSAHLLNFKGTDTISGVVFARKHYDAVEFPGYSIPAGEHSVTTSWGKDSEQEAFAHIIDTFRGKMVAMVIDTYDAFQAIDVHVKALKEKIETFGGRVVLRPDSGNPVAMAASCLERLMNVFGYTVNSKGYKVLPDCVRLIYGDGINETSLGDILRELTMRRISADNIAFGMGGALLQHLNRDTLKFAMKASAISEDGKTWKPIFKDPLTDPGKKSKPGVLALIRHSNGAYETVPRETLGNRQDLLEPVFENGRILRSQCFDDIRKLVNQTQEHDL